MPPKKKMFLGNGQPTLSEMFKRKSNMNVSTGDTEESMSSPIIESESETEMGRVHTSACSTSRESRPKIVETEDHSKDTEEEDGARSMNWKFKESVGIVEIRVNNRKHIRCEICHEFPNIVKQFNPRKPLAIVAAEGTRMRQNVLSEHLNSECHRSCLQAHRVNSLSSESGERSITALEACISHANRQQVMYVGKLMLQVFLDAKLLNLTARSWPSRYVCGEASHAYDPENQSGRTIANNVNLQYVNPHGHLEIMTTIAKSYYEDFMKKINEAWAISLRIDGSVDFTHKDKIYVMAKIVNLDGSLELLFIGIAIQKERKALGLKNTAMEAIKTNIKDAKPFLRKLSSLCTDGTNVNAGEKSSLWTLLDAELKAIESEIPVIKIWCGAHRAELAWEDTGKKFKAVGKVLSVLSSIASYFHNSGLRTAELEDSELTVFKLPKIFEIRWTNFTFTLLRSVLFSWEALVHYFKKNEKDPVCAGYYRYLTNLENLKLIAFLGDVLFVFQRFQKNLQSEWLTIVSLVSQVAKVKKSLAEMITTPLPGAFETNLSNKITTGEDGKKCLKSIELLHSNNLRSSHQNVSNFLELRTNILNSLQTFLDERFATDKTFVETIKPFITFEEGASIIEIHKMLAPDLLLANLSLQYQDISSNPDLHNYKDLSLIETILKLSKTAESRDNYKELITVLARIAACTPNSADVERCISSNNRLKTKQRSRVQVETENKYLFIHYNMPDLDNWNPTAAANLFVTEKIRRKRNTTTSTESNSRAQPYFHGVFPEARKLDIDDEEPNVTNKRNKKSANKFFDF